MDLVLSERTVSRPVASIFGKLGVSTRSAATAWAVKEGLVQITRRSSQRLPRIHDAVIALIGPNTHLDKPVPVSRLPTELIGHCRGLFEGGIEPSVFLSLINQPSGFCSASMRIRLRAPR